MASAHEWHSGELFIQEKLGHLEAVSRAHSTFRPQLTLQHQEFHTSLSILPVCTLDALGRPWGSFLVARDGEPGFISSDSFNNLQATDLALHQEHPLQEALQSGAKIGMQGLVLAGDEQRGPALRLVAGVGVMFGNRRRNKFAGFIDERRSSIQTGLTFEVMESLGNCPKYINTRHLAPYPAYQPKLLARSFNMQPNEALPGAALDHVAQADAVFLSTRYIAAQHTLFKSHLGINIRGGKPGFVRSAIESTLNADGKAENRQVVYFPDYSGNRFMSSLGNIYTDRVAGLTIPLLKKDMPIDVLYITGEAEILLDEDANRVFPGVRTAVRIVVTGFTYVQDAIPLRPSDPVEEDFEQKDVDGVGWSPYNPPVRRLRSELALSQDDNASTGSLIKAKVIAFDKHSDDLATVTFKLSTPMKYKAGQHIILDCSSLLSAVVKEYKHMSEKRGGERELNDSGTRTWTISSAPTSSAPQDSLQITIRRFEDGLVTPSLFRSQGKDAELPVLGIAGAFTLSNATRMVWVAQGIGLTPFMAFFQALASREELASPVQVSFVLALRKAKVAAMLRLITSAISGSQSSRAQKATVKLHLLSANLEASDGSADEEALLSASATSNLAITVERHKARLSSDWLPRHATSNGSTDAWVCGTPAFERVVTDGLAHAGFNDDRIYSESFSY